MSGQLGELVVSIQADIARFREDMGKANKVAQESAQQMSASFASVHSSITQMIGTLGTMAAGAGFKKMIEDAASWNLEAGKMARTMGITVEKASVMNVALTETGIGVDVAESAVLRLSKALATGTEKFDKYGIAVKDSSGNLLSMPEIIANVNESLKSAKTGTERNMEAMDIYGKSWKDVQSILKLTPSAMADAEKSAKSLHLIVGKEGVEQSAEYKKNLREIGLVVRSLSLQIGSDLLPAIKSVGGVMVSTAEVIGDNLDAIKFSLLAVTGASVISGLTRLATAIKDVGIASTLGGLGTVGKYGLVGAVGYGAYAGTNWLNQKLYEKTGIDVTGKATYDKYTKQDAEATARYNEMMAKRYGSKPDLDGDVEQDGKDSSAKEAQAAARIAEQWRRTYSDLKREIDRLNPSIDENGQKILDVTNKYDDLITKEGADVAKLKSLKAAMLEAIETRKLMDEAIAQNKVEMDEYKASQEAMEAAERSHWTEIADTIKKIDSMQPGSGLDAMNDQISAYQEIADQFPDMVDKVAVAIETLKQDFTGFDPKSNPLQAMADSLDVLYGKSQDVIKLESDYRTGLDKEKKLRDDLTKAEKAGYQVAMESLNAQIQAQQTLNAAKEKQIADMERLKVLNGEIVGFDNGRAIYRDAYQNEQVATGYTSNSDLFKTSASSGTSSSGYSNGFMTVDQLNKIPFLGGFATGSNYIPNDGLAYLHKGEAVVPAAQNTAAGASPVTVNGGISINLPNITRADDYATIARGVMAELTKLGGRRLATA